MSTEEKDEIMAVLKTLRINVRFLGWMVMVFGASAVGAIGWAVTVGVSDHFDQATLRADSDWMKPKVTKMWYSDPKHMGDL